MRIQLKLIPGLLFTAAALLSPTAQSAETYPSRTVRIIVPSAPGGSVDTLGRLVAQKLSTSLGQQFVVENRPGSGGVVGTEIVAKAQPDGYTLLMAYHSHVINPTLYKKLPFDTVKDFIPITQVAVQPLLFNVHPSLPANNPRELLNLAKARPGQILYGSAGSGSGGHLATEMFAYMGGVKMTHVPYKGASPALIDVIAGNTQLMVATFIASMGHINGGRLKAVGVSSAKRSTVLPKVPAISEAIPGFEALVSYFFLAPAGTPNDIIQKLSAESIKGLKAPDTVERLAANSAEPVASTPAETAKVIQSEMVKWGKIVQVSGAKAN
ncbi:MAG TPA: tripartite tricarboxylate transporter substrate binding protein [Burkholderiales bacterium]|nr:tripartite tricarboxylate transporter substrate binding protein [Burkholderiales bacterium]